MTGGTSSGGGLGPPDGARPVDGEPRPGSTDERGFGTVPRLLGDLLDHPLDPGYAAAARRRAAGGGTRPTRAPVSVVLLALGALAAGFVLALAYRHTHRAAPEAAQVHDRLVQRVRDAQQSADALAQQATAGQTQLNRARADALPGSVGTSDAAALAAGRNEVTGPGLRVTLSDPPASASAAPTARVGTVPITATSTLTDRDIRSVVNELWHDGAQAIAVNGVRLTPTSAIRFAGQAVLVDFTPVTSPYRVEAIGNPDAISVAFAQSAVASRYQTLVGVEGIGFGFTTEQKLTLPAGGVPASGVARPIRGGG